MTETGCSLSHDAKHLNAHTMIPATKASINATRFICLRELFRAKAYKDPAGTWTIGFGTAIDTAAEQYLITATITRDQGMQLLLKDMIWVDSAITTYIHVPLNQNQWDALASMIYNIGPTEFRRATNLRGAINNGAPIEEIEKRFKAFIYAGGKPRQFLIDRRNIEWELFVEPIKEAA